MQSATMRVAVALVLVIAPLLQPAESHTLGIGRCKKPNPIQNFQPDQFTGLWFVIEIFSTSSKCMTMTFNRTDTGFKVTEAREFLIGRMANIDHTMKNTGTFTIKDPANPSLMRASWPSNFISSADVTVIDTDYQNFAVIFECQSLLVVNRHSAVILSRKPELDAQTIEKIKTDLKAFGIDVTDFDIMDHRNCNAPGEADFNWEIDEDTFSFINPGSSDPSVPEIDQPVLEIGSLDPSTPEIDQPELEIIDADPTENEVF